MKALRLFVAGITCGLAFICSTASGQCEDFTFVIPVAVSNLPSDVARMGFGCSVNNSAGTTIGQGTATVAVAAAAYHGDVTIAFNVNPGWSPSDAVHWLCQGYFIGSESPPIFYFENYTSPTFPVLTGAPFRLQDFNSITR